jgi:DNA-binding NarL/FixJ family response regulator
MNEQEPDLRGVAVLVVSDHETSERQLVCTLEARGCVIRRISPKLRLDREAPYDAGLIAVRRPCGWTAGIITMLRASTSACAVVAVLGEGGPDEIARALRDGAVDCLLEPFPSSALLDSLSNAIACTYRWRRRVADASNREMRRLDMATHRGRARVFEPVHTATEVGPAGVESLEVVVDRLTTKHGLTAREREVLYWLVRGHRYDDIGTVLGIATRTAKFHAANLLRKLEIESRHDLTLLLTKSA